MFLEKKEVAVGTLDDFLGLFQFRSAGSMLVGIEREAFLVQDSKITPLASQVIEQLPDGNRFGYELSACQLEDRIGPCRLENLKYEISANDQEIMIAEERIGFSRSFLEVAPESMPLDVYPDPTGRYQSIVSTMPREVLLSACRVIGTHVHIGMPDHETALRVYNGVLPFLEALCWMGDGSCGERLSIYKKVAPRWAPPAYASWYAFYEEALSEGFVSDPRKCWHLIRLSVHGTIEFRMFGATRELDRIVSWANRCHELCSKLL